MAMDEQPGHWVTNQYGERCWQGRRHWFCRHGPATIESVCGRPSAVMNCLMEDGRRRTVFRLFPVGTEIEPQWCYPVDSQPLQCGEIVITADDVEFRGAAARPNPSFHLSGARGSWREHSRGGRVWHGPSCWADGHGAAVIGYLYGRPTTVYGCLLPDGTRGTISRGKDTYQKRSDSLEKVEGRWKRELPDGSWIDGDIEASDSEIRFVDDPPRRRRQLGERSPDDAPNLHVDLMASPRIAELVKDVKFAIDLYRAFYNVTWSRNGRRWSCTWRGAGDIVAELRDLNEDYSSFYCSGREGEVATTVEAEFRALGWEEYGFG